MIVLREVSHEFITLPFEFCKFFKPASL